MKINRRTHLEIRLQNTLFSLLFLVIVGLVAWLTTRYTAQFDWTYGSRQSLSEASKTVLDQLEGPVTVTAYARENPMQRQKIREQIERYRRHKQDLTLDFVNPDTQPDKVREIGITIDGELLVRYQGRDEKVSDPAENAMTNALQRLASGQERHVVFIQGHGERSPEGQANHDLSQFVAELERKGILTSTVNLAVTAKLPEKISALVLASPRSKLLPGELNLIQNYIRDGGNFWWLTDPGHQALTAPLAEQLGIQFLPGTVVDASTQLFGLSDPSFALVAEYPPHPVTSGFATFTVFPAALAMEKKPGGDFEGEPLLSTLERSWTETGPIEGKIRFDAGQAERAGPLDIGYALTRPRPKPAEAKPPTDTEAKPGEQRILVIGDGDFLSNAYLGSGGNIDLGMNMVQWLGQNDAFINVPIKPTPDRKLELSPFAQGFIALGFLILLPLILIGSGTAIWFQRRRR
ncbi:ABC transporter [Candidatus Woesearchaeota archaeon]|nr:ABC transporter [Candidatus Woesearchaeota archaeon]